MRDAPSLTRRDLLASAAGAGVFVFFGLDGLLAQEPERLPARAAVPTDFNAYLRIGADGRVTCLVGKVELGQGSMTAIAQLCAEELDVSFDSIDMVMGDTDLCPFDIGTFGSLTIRSFGPVFRAAAAEARAVLLSLAAERLGVPADRLAVTDGVVRDAGGSGKSVTYAALAGEKRIARRLANVPVKAFATYKVVGTSPRRKDAREKVTGRAVYAADQVVPEAWHARILRPPAHGARLENADTEAAAKIPGVRVVRDGDLIAVLHPSWDVADQALRLVKATFSGAPSPDLNNQTIFDHLARTAPPARLLGEKGDLTAGEKAAARLIERTYRNAYVAHAPMETHAAVAKIDGGKVTLWASTQAPFSVKQQVAGALGIPPASVRVVTPFVGGGFGGKSGAPQAVEAARLAKLAGIPVRVVWDRAEEFFLDTFRPAAVVTIRSGLTASNAICLWDYKVLCAGDREAEQFYEVPNQRTLSAGGWQGAQPPGLHPFGVGPWRAPSVNTNTFARESQIDVMAAVESLDPVSFRKAHLKDPRMLRTLAAATETFGWTPKATPSGRGVGVACALYLGTYVATCAEVEVDRVTGRVRVKRVVCSQDMGVIVNPDGARQQTEGAVTMGLGYALGEEVRFSGGAVLDRNFDTYELPRFSWLPSIETVFVDNPASPSSGCGEPPIVCMGAVIANAVFDATGARLFDLPMTPARVLAVIRLRRRPAGRRRVPPR